MLAVLPFENLTGDPDQEYIGDGMTEELIAQLGRMDPSRLGVIARTSAMQFKKTTKRADQIGSDLGVSYLLEGSVRTTGSRIRIAVQLIETQSESQLWAEQYERDAKDLLTLQREVAEAITRQITTSLGVARFERQCGCPTAFDDRRGVRALSTRALSLADRTPPRDSRRRREHFRRAIDLDASYALAYSGLADTYTLLGAYGFLPMREAYPLGRAAALKALELDDTLGGSAQLPGGDHGRLLLGLGRRRTPFRARHRVEPELRDGRSRFYSFYLACMGRPEEALAFAERARAIWTRCRRSHR